MGDDRGRDLRAELDLARFAAAANTPRHPLST